MTEASTVPLPPPAHRSLGRKASLRNGLSSALSWLMAGAVSWGAFVRVMAGGRAQRLLVNQGVSFYTLGLTRGGGGQLSVSQKVSSWL